MQQLSTYDGLNQVSIYDGQNQFQNMKLVSKEVNSVEKAFLGFFNEMQQEMKDARIDNFGKEVQVSADSTQLTIPRRNRSLCTRGINLLTFTKKDDSVSVEITILKDRGVSRKLNSNTPSIEFDHKCVLFEKLRWPHEKSNFLQNLKKPLVCVLSMNAANQIVISKIYRRSFCVILDGRGDYMVYFKGKAEGEMEAPKEPKLDRLQNTTLLDRFLRKVRRDTDIKESETLNLGNQLDKNSADYEEMCKMIHEVDPNVSFDKSK